MDNCNCLSCRCKGQLDIFAAVIADLRVREESGAREYGRKKMTAHDGRDTIQDAYEEALDLALYLRKMIAEREGK